MKNKYKDKTFLLGSGKIYDLKIHKMLEVYDNQRYYIAVDMNGLKHLIPEVHYRHYEIKPGDKISCRLDRINCQGRFFFEPAHPFYEQGKTYRFALKGFRKIYESGSSGFIAIVEDKYGIVWETLPVQMITSTELKTSYLRCYIKRVKKARLTLVINDPRLHSD